MSEKSKIAIIGDRNLFLPLRAFGLTIFSPATLEEARDMLAQVVDEKYALCLIQEEWMEKLSGELSALSQKFSPVWMGFSDYRGIFEAMEKFMSELSIKATGSDALFSRGRKNHETR